MTTSVSGAVRIVAARGAARACVQLSALVLLPVWGVVEFGRFAAAVGMFSWLVFVVLGVEKAALTVLPRCPTLAAELTRMLIARAAGLFGLALVAAAALAAAGPTPALYGAAAAYAAGQGVLSVLASLHRLAGRPGRESAAFVALALWVAAMTGLALAGVLGPYGYLLTLVVGVVAVSAVLAAGISTERARRRGRLGRLLSRRIGLLGLSEVADSASISVLYLLITVAGLPGAAALVYAAMVVSNVAGGFTMLLMRIAQPATSLRLRGVAGHTGRARARRLSGWACAGAGAAVVLGTLVLDPLRGSHFALWTVVAVEMTVFTAVGYAMYLLENTDGVALATTSSAAVVGLLATTGAAFVAIPVGHAVGAVLALVAGLAAKAGFLWVRIGRSPAGHRDRVLLDRTSAK